MEFVGPYILGLNTMGFAIGVILKNPWVFASNVAAICLNMAVMLQ